MGAISIPSQVTRQTTSARTARTPKPGELVYDTQLQTLFAGDGATAGGVAAANANQPNTFVAQSYGAKGDGTTDDTTAIQSAVNAASAAKGTLSLPPTTNGYIVSGTITVPSNVTIAGGGTLIPPAGVNFSVFDLNAVSNVLIRDISIVKAAGAVSAGVTADLVACGILIRGVCTDITLDRVTVNAMGTGIKTNGELGTVPGTSQRITYRNCHVLNSNPSWGIEISGASDVDVTGCRSDGNWLDGFKLEKLTTNVTVRGCQAIGNGQAWTGSGYNSGNVGTGIDCYAGGDTMVISDFVGDSNSGNGISMKTDTLTRDDPADWGYTRNIQVNGCRCRSNRGIGLAIYVWTQSDEQYNDNSPTFNAATIPMLTHVRVSGGQFDSNMDRGLWLNAANVSVDGASCRYNYFHGIEVGVRSMNTTIRGCKVLGNGTNAANTYHGIYVAGKWVRIRDCTILGNDTDIVRTDADYAALTPSQQWGIYVDSTYTQDIEISGNIVRYNHAGNISTAMTSGKCLIHQTGTGAPSLTGSIGSTYVQEDASDAAHAFWVKTSGAPNATTGWDRPLMISRVGTDVLAPTGNGSGLTNLSAANVAGVPAGVLKGAAGAFASASAGTDFLAPGGVAGGQTAYGGTNANDSLALHSTSNATKGNVLIAPDGGKVGVGTTAPLATFQVGGATAGSITFPTSSGPTIPQNILAPTSGLAAHNIISMDGTNNPCIGLFADSTNHAVGIGYTYAAGGADFGIYGPGAVRQVWIAYGTGNFGVGVSSSPDYKLKVAPTANAPSGKTVYFSDQTASTGVTKEVIQAGAGQGTSNLTEWWPNGNSTPLAAVSPTGAWASNVAQTTANGSVSGSAVFSQPGAGAAWKRVIVYCNALNGTASYTFPTAFSHVPAIVTTNGPAASVVTSLTASAVTVTGAPTTGFLIIEGY